MKSFVFACFAFLLCHSAFAETLYLKFLDLDAPVPFEKELLYPTLASWSRLKVSMDRSGTQGDALAVSHPSGRTTEQAIPAGIEGGRVFRNFLLPSLQKQKCAWTMETSEEAIRIAHELGIRTPLFCTDIMPEDFEELQMKEVRLRILFEQLQLQRPKRDFKYKTLKSKLIAWSYHLIQEALTRDSPLLLSAVLNEKLVTIHDSVPVKESRYYIGDKIIWHYDFNWNTNLTSTDSATDETMSLIHFAIFWKARESILFLIRSGADIYDKKALRVMCSSKDMNASERIHKYFRKDENFLKEINSFVESQKAAIGRKMQNG